MSHSIGQSVADSLTLCLGYARRLLKDVTPDTFARFAAPGGTVVESNHPAFVLGHLSLYACRVVDQLGGDASTVTPNDQFQKVFGMEATCVDDPDGSIYPAMEEVTSEFFKNYEAALESLKSAPDEAFQKPNPHPRLAEKFPTMGSMHAFYCGGHIMMHLGQISAWRRMQGMGSA
ncbi:MAG: DinB family protein [Planctomycetaceae bacterium]|nr:DinB family protein [Planctomycetaceae bacterium]MCB9951307.1 DinB family protein [Planctomycetaceae bacterium]